MLKRHFESLDSMLLLADMHMALYSNVSDPLFGPTVKL